MRFFLVFAALLIGAVPAFAQLTLPGATAPAAEGSIVTPAPVRAKAKPRAVRALPPVIPPESNLAGKTVFLNGAKSQMTFLAHDKAVDLSRLTLSGVKLSNRRDECQVDVSGMPLTLTPVPRADGLTHLSVPLPACPLVLDILDGAVFVTSETGICTFTQADCEAAAGGLWGTPPGEIGPDQVKTIERQRRGAETSLRNAYKGLMGSTKDRAMLRGIASEQAGFSSQREEVCRDYVGEGRHGFCATRMTQARATVLQTAFSTAVAAKEARKKGSSKSR